MKFWILLTALIIFVVIICGSCIVSGRKADQIATQSTTKLTETIESNHNITIINAAITSPNAIKFNYGFNTDAFLQAITQYNITQIYIENFPSTHTAAYYGYSANFEYVIAVETERPLILMWWWDV